MELSSRLQECQNGAAAGGVSFRFSVFRLFNHEIHPSTGLGRAKNTKPFRAVRQFASSPSDFAKLAKCKNPLIYGVLWHFAKSPSLFRGVGVGGAAEKVERAEFMCTSIFNRRQSDHHGSTMPLMRELFTCQRTMFRQA